MRSASARVRSPATPTERMCGPRPRAHGGDRKRRRRRSGARAAHSNPDSHGTIVLMRAYVDSDILIWHLRGQSRAADLLRRLAGEVDIELWTGALQRAEIVFFMRPNEEAATRTFLARFRTEAVSQAI